MIQINGSYYQESDIKKIGAIEPTSDGYSFHVVISTPYEPEPYKREVLTSGKDFFEKSMLQKAHSSILAQLSVARKLKKDTEDAEMEAKKLHALRNIKSVGSSDISEIEKLSGGIESKSTFDPFLVARSLPR